MDQFAGATESQDWFESNIDGGQRKQENEQHKDVLSPRCCTDGSEESNLGTFHRLRNASKPHSTPLTLKWLEENYEIAEGVCIPRSTLYYHYLDYCETNDTQPVNAASFGKIIRQQFPQITTRRLGTRGQSKYHYYGIGVKEASAYYEVMYSAKGIQSSGEGKKDNAKQIVAYSPRSKLGTLLPDFPDLKEVKLPANVSEDKVLTFMMMYRTHCQRILDTVIRANFDEVQSFLLHFWQGMPQHMVPILDSQTIVMLVGVCDSILYKAIANVLMPTVLQALPDSLTQVIRRFAKQLDEWLRIALDSLPTGLQRIKFDLARRFAQVLRRQTSLNHLCQAARTVIHSVEITSQMLDDWLSIDLNSIIKQTLYTMDSYSDRDHDIIVSLCTEFENLLEEQAPLESYIEWLDTMVDRCVVKLSKKKPKSLRRIARQFLLMWSCFGTRVIRDMTLHSAPSFGSFHLMHLMFDDYVLYLVETLHSQERANDFLRHITGEQTDDICEEDILPDSSVIKEAITSSEGISSYSSPFINRQSERDSVITRARDIIGNISETEHPHLSTISIEDQPTTSSCEILHGNNMPVEMNRSGETNYNIITSESLSHCSAFSPPFPQSSQISNNSNNTVYQTGYTNSQPQVSIPPLFLSATRNTSEMTITHDLNRFSGGINDWSAPCGVFNQQDTQGFPRAEPLMYPQIAGARHPALDCNTYGYFDQQATCRNFLSTGSDVMYQGMDQSCDQNSPNLTNTGAKRSCEDTNGKVYKRMSRGDFHLQDSYG